MTHHETPNRPSDVFVCGKRSRQPLTSNTTKQVSASSAAGLVIERAVFQGVSCRLGLVVCMCREPRRRVVEQLVKKSARIVGQPQTCQDHRAPEL